MAEKRTPKRVLDMASSSVSKRSCLLSPSKIQMPEAKANVNAIISSLSPAKKSNYFQGELTDGEAVISLLGFDSKHRQTLEQYKKEGKTFTLKNCQINENKLTGKLQVIVKSYTVIEPAGPDHDKFIIKDPSTLGSPVILLRELDEYNVYDRVTVKVAVLKVSDVEILSSGKQKQEVIIADKSASVTLTLWENKLNTLNFHESYELCRVQVGEFGGKKSLSFPMFGACIKKITDLEEVCIVTEEDEMLEEVFDACVIGVNQLEFVACCIHCKKSMLVSGEDEIVTCSICKTAQKYSASSAKLSAKLYIKDSFGEMFTVRANDSVLDKISSGSPINTESLLQSSLFDFTYNKFKSIVSVKRSESFAID